MAYRDTGYGFSVTDDQRADGRPAMGYVIATNSFLSGWGLARNVTRSNRTYGPGLR